MYLLDTDTCIYWLKGHSGIEQKIIAQGVRPVATSFITIAELYYGAYKSQFINKNLAAVRKLEKTLLVIDSDSVIVECFGEIKANLEQSGTRLDDADIYIAACALAQGAILVTNNEKHFKRLKKSHLRMENWVTAKY